MIGTLADLRTELSGYGNRSAAYIEKQMHRVPGADVVVRETFILERCKGRVVLDIGASGNLHAAIVEHSRKCYGIDRFDGEGIVGIDLDDYHAKLPVYEDVEIVVCGEVIEHLSNPGWFLKRLRDSYHCPVIITVPNAFTEIGQRHMRSGIENVNNDHVAWYSHRTMKTLLARHGYEIKQFYWYNGRARFAEGLIIVTE